MNPTTSGRRRAAADRNDAPAIFAAITAAGTSSRMGSVKALLAWNERTLLSRMIDALAQAGFPSPAVVTGAAGAEVAAEARRWGATPLANPDYQKGRFTSIRVAARWALARADREERRPALLLWPVDCPGVHASTLASLARAAARRPRANIAPSFSGRTGHPVVLCAETLLEIAAGPDDANLRDLILRAADGRRPLEVDDPAVLDNLNTPEDYTLFLSERSGAAHHG